MKFFDLLTERLAERLDCPVSELAPNTTFESLGLDSLDLADLLIELENELNIEIEADRKILTLQDLSLLVEKILSSGQGELP